MTSGAQHINYSRNCAFVSPLTMKVGYNKIEFPTQTFPPPVKSYPMHCNTLHNCSNHEISPPNLRSGVSSIPHFGCGRDGMSQSSLAADRCTAATNKNHTVVITLRRVVGLPYTLPIRVPYTGFHPRSHHHDRQDSDLVVPRLSLHHRSHSSCYCGSSLRILHTKLGSQKRYNSSRLS